MMPSLFVQVRRAAVIFVLVISWGMLVHAQGITPEQYVADCRAYVNDGNAIAARGACEGALQLDATFDEAGRLLAQLDINAGNNAAARTRLEAMQRERPHSDTLVILASIAALEQQPTALEQYLTRIQQLPPPTDELAVPFLEVQLHLLRGEYTDAIHDVLHDLSTSETASDEIILTELTFLLRMREFTSTTEHFAYLPKPTAPLAAAEFELLAARLTWATGNLAAAQAHYEAAFEAQGATVQHEAYTTEHEYALVLLGQGDLADGYRAWLSADSRAHGQWWMHPFVVSWITVILLIIALTIVAESNIPQTFGRYAPANRQALWSAGGSLAIIGAGTLLASMGVLATSAVFFGSWFALFAPPNILLLRMLYVTYVLLATGLIAFGLLQQYTKSALHELRGPKIHWLGVFWGGVVVAGLTCAWEAWAVPRFGFADVPFEMFAPLPVIVLFAAALVIGELFFRGFLVPTFQLRYPTVTAVALAALLYGFVLGVPVALVTLISAFLSWLYTKNRSGLTLAFAMTFGLCLLFFITTIMPQLRTLFF